MQDARACQPPIAGLIDRVIGNLLPAHCYHCHSLKAVEDGLCSSCRLTLQPLQQQCRRCALALVTQAEVCGQCLRQAHAIDAAWAGFRYQDAVKSLIRSLKFQGCLSAGQSLSQLLARQYCPLDFSQADIVIPAPLHLSRLRQRGFNQALELCRDFAAVHGLDIQHHMLKRIQPTQEQAKLNARQRQANVALAFACQEELSGQCVVLFDDVMTTGATMKAMAKTLKAAGARQVIAVAAARA